MARSLQTLALAISLSSMLGCGDSSPASDETETGTSTGETGDGDPGTVSLSASLVTDMCDQPMVDTKVCWYSSAAPLCTETDDEGAFVLTEIPAGQRGGVGVFNSNQVFDTYLPMTMPSTPDTEVEAGEYCLLPAFAALSGWYATAGLDMSTETGTIVVQVLFAVDAEVTLDPPADHGPYYIGEDGVIDFEAEGMLANDGRAVFLDLEPGQYTVTVEYDGMLCTQGIPVGEYPALVDLAANSVTWAVVNCDG